MSEQAPKIREPEPQEYPRQLWLFWDMKRNEWLHSTEEGLLLATHDANKAHSWANSTSALTCHYILPDNIFARVAELERERDVLKAALTTAANNFESYAHHCADCGSLGTCDEFHAMAAAARAALAPAKAD